MLRLTITTSVLLAALVLMPMVTAHAASPQAVTLQLRGLAEDGGDLAVHLLLREGRVERAFGSGYSQRSHPVEAAGLIIGAGRIHGELGMTLQPDPWRPADGRTVPMRIRIDVREDDGAWAGRYTATANMQTSHGDVVGAGPDIPAAQADAQIRIRVPGALLRLYQARGPNWRYALDMNLLVLCTEGDVRHVLFETPVPDYRRYSAVVERHDLRFDGTSLRGTMRIMIDNGGQGIRGRDIPRREVHTLSIDMAIVGSTAGGVGRIEAGDLAENLNLVGSATFAPPPPPTQATAWLRLHNAMQDDMPVLLNLSLHEDRTIHGLAWAPGHNHQPHSVDASRLRLEGNRLAGELRVGVVPDVYKDDEPFELTYQMDARVEHGGVVGSFEGSDRGEAQTGQITGLLRPRAEPAVGSLDGSALVELRLGYCLVRRGDLPRGTQVPGSDHHAAVRLELADGQASSARLLAPDGAPLVGRVTQSDLTLEGDRLTGTVVFEVESLTMQPGPYRFDVTGMVEGTRINGYWRGTLNERPILTRSAKLGGAIEARE